MPKTINGLIERVAGLERLVEEQIQQIREDIRELKENDIKHLREDVEEIKKMFWKAAGGLAVVLFLLQLLLKLLK